MITREFWAIGILSVLLFLGGCDYGYRERMVNASLENTRKAVEKIYGERPDEVKKDFVRFGSVKPPKMDSKGVMDVLMFDLPGNQQVDTVIELKAKGRQKTEVRVKVRSSTDKIAISRTRLKRNEEALVAQIEKVLEQTPIPFPVN